MLKIKLKKVSNTQIYISLIKQNTHFWQEVIKPDEKLIFNDKKAKNRGIANFANYSLNLIIRSKNTICSSCL